MDEQPARARTRGRPSREAEMRLDNWLLQGEVRRLLLSVGAALRRQHQRASWHHGAQQDEAAINAALLRVLRRLDTLGGSTA